MIIEYIDENTSLGLLPLLSFTRWNSPSFFEGSKTELLGLNQTTKWLQQKHFEQSIAVQAMLHKKLRKIPVLHPLVSQKYCIVGHVKG